MVWAGNWLDVKIVEDRADILNPICLSPAGLYARLKDGIQVFVSDVEDVCNMFLAASRNKRSEFAHTLQVASPPAHRKFHCSDSHPWGLRQRTDDCNENATTMSCQISTTCASFRYYVLWNPIQKMDIKDVWSGSWLNILHSICRFCSWPTSWVFSIDWALNRPVMKQAILSKACYKARQNL